MRTAAWMVAMMVVACVAPATAPAAAGDEAKDKAAALTAERKQALVEGVENFNLLLRYCGPEDKPFYRLWLSVPPIMKARAGADDLTARSDRQTALKVIDWLADSGALGAAEDMSIQEHLRPQPKGPCYVVNINGGKVSLLHNLGWGPDFAKQLTALRTLLKDDAGKQMDVLLGRLSGYWKEWTGKPYEPGGADKAAQLTAERKNELVADLENFALTLRYFGDQDKPFYWLTLCRRMRATSAVYQFELTGVMDKDTTLKVIDWLADSGILGEAGEATPQTRILEKGPCYVATLTGGKKTLIYNFGWGADLAKRLAALRALLKGDPVEKKNDPSAAKQMDTFIGRLSGFWKEWTGKPYEPPAPAAGAGLEQSPTGNFVLYVSNQSFDLTPVDIKVTIDGRVAVDEPFDVAGKKMAQHNWKTFVFTLAKGPHVLKAESAKGEAAVTQTFEVKDKEWGVVDFWYDSKATVGPDPKKKKLFCRFQDAPIKFD